MHMHIHHPDVRVAVVTLPLPALEQAEEICEILQLLVYVKAQSNLFRLSLSAHYTSKWLE